jgi:hypothetical protein
LAAAIIVATWEFIYEIWIVRNKIEHDKEGKPEIRKREKLVEIIVGKSEIINYDTYSKKDVEMGVLTALLVENLQMIEKNI